MLSTIILVLFMHTSLATCEDIDWENIRYHVRIAEFAVYEQGGSEESSQKNYINLKKRADAGEVFATFFIAYDYYFKNDYENASKYFKSLSEKCDGPADSFIGHMYAEGLGTDKDLNMAIIFYKKHVSSNDAVKYRARAAYNISKAYDEKNGDLPTTFAHKDSVEMREAQMSTAWLYVSLWMGHETAYIANNKEIPLAQFINSIELKNDPQKMTWVKEQALEICSSINGCIAPNK